MSHEPVTRSTLSSPAQSRPNVVLILVDDMGYSDLGCYGSEIATPHLDRLADEGVRMTQFYNTARCTPSRASLLTGLHPHQTGIGVLTRDDGPGGYPGTLNERCVTTAEVLSASGYRTYMSGKWHLTGQVHEPSAAWPTRRGFDHFFGILAGASSYYQPVTLTRDEAPVEVTDGFYLTDAIEQAASAFVVDHVRDHGQDPFFLYVPFNAPHWPLHAPEDDIARYDGVYDEGWDELRRRRFDRQVDSALLDGSWELSERDAEVPPWDETADHDWQARRMAVYAAQVELMDAAVGRLVETLRTTGELDDTVIIFLSDNGGCAEEIPSAWVDELAHPPLHTPQKTLAGERVRRGNSPEITPGPPATFASYGKPWANLSNTPFREYKHWVHEGGISTPLIVRGPGIGAGLTSHVPHQLPDVLATLLEVTGADYPRHFQDRDVPPLEGTSMVPTWRGEGLDPERLLFWEHEGNGAVRQGRWKLVRKHAQPWELYDLDADRTELVDRAGDDPDRVKELAEAYEQWAQRSGVLPREQVLATMDPPGKGERHVEPFRSARRVAP